MTGTNVGEDIDAVTRWMQSLDQKSKIDFTTSSSFSNIPGQGSLSKTSDGTEQDSDSEA